MNQEKPPSRGWLVPSDGSPPLELPQHLLGDDVITWPPTLPEKKPGQPVKYLDPKKDFYHRAVLKSENVYVYVQEGRDPNALPDSVAGEIRRQLGRPK